MSFASSILTHLTPKMLMTLGVPIVTVAAVAGIAVGSNAAFVSSTNTDTNNWATGVVQLTSDHAGTAAFAPSAIVPGYTETHCIVVSSGSTVPSDVKLFASSSNSAPLSYDLQFNIQTGTGGTDVPGVNGAPGSCSGFTPDAANPTIFSGSANDFMTNHTDSLTGVGAVDLAPGESKTYMITATLPSSSNRQGATTSTAFTWLATNK
jgi:hypothetical protein